MRSTRRLASPSLRRRQIRTPTGGRAPGQDDPAVADLLRSDRASPDPSTPISPCPVRPRQKNERAAIRSSEAHCPPSAEPLAPSGPCKARANGRQTGDRPRLGYRIVALIRGRGGFI